MAAAATLDVEVVASGAGLAVVVSGELTVRTVEVFRRRVGDRRVCETVAGEGVGHLTVDLGSVTELDAAGLMAATGLALSARRNGRTAVCVAPADAGAAVVVAQTGVVDLLNGW